VDWDIVLIEGGTRIGVVVVSTAADVLDPSPRTVVERGPMVMGGLGDCIFWYVRSPYARH
jgi:hypothetical protein